MNPIELLFSFNGRIGRGQYWAGMAVAAIAALGLTVALTALMFAAMAATSEEANVGHAILGAFGFLLFQFLASALLKLNIAALAAKRLHDLGVSGLWSVGVLAGPTPLGVMSIYSAMAMGGFTAPWYAPGYIILFVTTAFLLALVALGIAPGQKGDNRFEPSPRSASGPVPGEIRGVAANRPVQPAQAPLRGFGRKPAH